MTVTSAAPTVGGGAAPPDRPRRGPGSSGGRRGLDSKRRRGYKRSRSGEVPTRSARCISPPSTIWKRPFNRLFSGAKVGRRGVTILILLVLVVFLWVAVLAPSAWRRFGERQGVGSIDHFHHQLSSWSTPGPRRSLRPTGCTPRCPAEVVRNPCAPTVDSSRPKLVLLRPTDDADAADVDDGDGAPLREGRCARPARSRRACPKSAWHCHAFGASRPNGAARCCCGASAVWPSRPGSSGCGPACTRLGLHRPLRAGRPRPGRAHGLRQGARGRAAPAAAPVGGSTRAPSGPGDTSPGAGYPGAWDDDDYDLPRSQPADTR